MSSVYRFALQKAYLDAIKKIHRLVMAQEAYPTNESPLDFKALAKDISEVPGVMSCTIIDNHAEVQAQVEGEIPHGAEMMRNLGVLGAVIWGATKVGEREGGALTSVMINYRTFRVIGVPIQGTKVAALITASIFIDANQLVSKMTSIASAMLENVRH